MSHQRSALATAQQLVEGRHVAVFPLSQHLHQLGVRSFLLKFRIGEVASDDGFSAGGGQWATLAPNAVAGCAMAYEQVFSLVALGWGVARFSGVVLGAATECPRR